MCEDRRWYWVCVNGNDVGFPYFEPTPEPLLPDPPLNDDELPCEPLPGAQWLGFATYEKALTVRAFLATASVERVNHYMTVTFPERLELGEVTRRIRIIYYPSDSIGS
jgi:hypothetical protein